MFAHHPHGRADHVVELHGADFKFAGLAGEHADAFDDVGHAVGLFHDQGQPLPQLCRRDVPSSLHADEQVLGQAAGPDQGLVEFVGDGGRHFAQRSQTVGGHARARAGRPIRARRPGGPRPPAGGP